MAYRLSSMRDERGFTLIELLVVVIIMSILTSIAIASYTFSSSRTKEAVCTGNLRTIRSVVESYKGLNGHYPVTLDELIPDYIKTATGIICPETGQPYNDNYNNVTGEVTCPNCEP